mmetsp:Transcript_67710/g.209337  ORF Transcript_67710/g.209337 Transcript_67710/m.209337 type:complete len:899 (+) Transcript_67710:517-3213(+)
MHAALADGVDLALPLHEAVRVLVQAALRLHLCQPLLGACRQGQLGSLRHGRPPAHVDMAGGVPQDVLQQRALLLDDVLHVRLRRAGLRRKRQHDAAQRSAGLGRREVLGQLAAGPGAAAVDEHGRAEPLAPGRQRLALLPEAPQGRNARSGPHEDQGRTRVCPQVEGPAGPDLQQHLVPRLHASEEIARYTHQLLGRLRLRRHERNCFRERPLAGLFGRQIHDEARHNQVQLSRRERVAGSDRVKPGAVHRQQSQERQEVHLPGETWEVQEDVRPAHAVPRDELVVDVRVPSGPEKGVLLLRGCKRSQLRTGHHGDDFAQARQLQQELAHGRVLALDPVQQGVEFLLQAAWHRLMRDEDGIQTHLAGEGTAQGGHAAGELAPDGNHRRVVARGVGHRGAGEGELHQGGPRSGLRRPILLVALNHLRAHAGHLDPVVPEAVVAPGVGAGGARTFEEAVAGVRSVLAHKVEMHRRVCLPALPQRVRRDFRDDELLAQALVGGEMPPPPMAQSTGGPPHERTHPRLVRFLAALHLVTAASLNEPQSTSFFKGSIKEGGRTAELLVAAVAETKHRVSLVWHLDVARGEEREEPLGLCRRLPVAVGWGQNQEEVAVCQLLSQRLHPCCATCTANALCIQHVEGEGGTEEGGEHSSVASGCPVDGGIDQEDPGASAPGFSQQPCRQEHGEDGGAELLRGQCRVGLAVDLLLVAAPACGEDPRWLERVLRHLVQIQVGSALARANRGNQPLPVARDVAAAPQLVLVPVVEVLNHCVVVDHREVGVREAVHHSPGQRHQRLVLPEAAVPIHGEPHALRDRRQHVVAVLVGQVTDHFGAGEPAVERGGGVTQPAKVKHNVGDLRHRAPLHVQPRQEREIRMPDIHERGAVRGHGEKRGLFLVGRLQH